MYFDQCFIIGGQKYVWSAKLTCSKEGLHTAQPKVMSYDILNFKQKYIAEAAKIFEG